MINKIDKERAVLSMAAAALAMRMVVLGIMENVLEIRGFSQIALNFAWCRVNPFANLS
ncbi:MAG: hypothetical protein GY737_03000 [Desulfobacteraceae bacterium]|nr:hypothetical protein [Desulfobacteraceae bacterium]